MCLLPGSAEGLKENSTLTELNLEYNYKIGPEGAKGLVFGEDGVMRGASQGRVKT